jgi:hypothetical protein
MGYIGVGVAREKVVDIEGNYILSKCTYSYFPIFTHGCKFTIFD